jgi:hypothetical protein
LPVPLVPTRTVPIRGANATRSAAALSSRAPPPHIVSATGGNRKRQTQRIGQDKGPDPPSLQRARVLIGLVVGAHTSER